MTDAKPKALQLVEESDNGDWIVGTGQWREEAAAELRRLHEENTALRQAIEQAEKQEPVNTMPTKIVGPNLEQILNAAGFYKREWVGLTDEEIDAAKDVAPPNLGGEYYREDVEEIARAIAAKIKEKNT
jgi:predicted flap endonuclease-1-like 5' DNA nuclease